MSSAQMNDNSLEPTGRLDRVDDRDPFAAFDGHGAFTGSNDPNDSYELRDMVSVGHSYVDRGMLNDAEDMLQEALASGYSREDAGNLERRIRDGRPANTLEYTATPTLSDNPAPPSAISPESFTRPLPGEDGQPAIVRQALAESDADIVAGRMASAYDVMLRAIALAPAFLPTYIRLAELRVACGDDEGAAEIISTLNESIGVWGDDTDWLVLSLRVSLNPTDEEALIALARALLEMAGTLQLDPYVPDSIERSLRNGNVDVALELARGYVRLRPHDALAIRLHLRSLALGGDEGDARAAIERDVTADMAADLLCPRAAVEYGPDRTSWIIWLERTTQRLLTHHSERDQLPQALDAVRTHADRRSNQYRRRQLQCGGHGFSGLGQIPRLVVRSSGDAHCSLRPRIRSPICVSGGVD